MPIYEYHCKDCDRVFEMLIKDRSDKPECPFCEGRVKRVMSRFGMELKGSGFYRNDYE